ncbi:D-glutamate cyclase, mitochondrial-like [Acipenser oxyrinchus oxyrinchus]|uniref:D-glutamate cyclase, mitochondrial n=1 Tax=Acipenser oxyrinchus oxyrinchus TaxID=40147 RepID=A0AAD8CDK2_ACIOX|nr:D-glutamate cyclase, mitochondrial-like [Acipenser oxyrinchus oxyrinchus]
MFSTRSFRSFLPSAIRMLIHDGKRARGTSGMVGGYKQAQIVILHKFLADDFEKFCHANSGPLPLLYRSQPGEWKYPKDNSDIGTDCPQYCRHELGNLTGSVPDLLEYSKELEEMVTFYLGGSFSVEQMLLKAGVPLRHVEQNRTISMYKTSVPCLEVGRFQCNMVVSMRPVPEGKLDAVAQATHPARDVHGAPVHIGHPGLIGIQDLSRPDYGEPVQPHQGDVPVFWACGVTGVEAVQSCKPPLAFTHSPGRMFITDCKRNESSPVPNTDPAETVQTFCISQNPLHYSIASAAAVQKIRALECHIGADPGDRGIKALFIQDELLKASLCMSHAVSVLITTGFPTHFNQDPPEETDGPPGAIAMAAMLQALKKQVAIVTDHRALEMNKKIIDDAVEQGILRTQVPLLSFQDNSQDSTLRFLCQDGNPQTPRYDHLVAIERAGRAADGNYYNMRKVNIKHLVDPIDTLFTTASTIPGIITTGIGDGGNELGMGKVKEAVRKFMPHGELVACDVGADFAITAGVSNWGGYAVACALYILNCCPIHDRYLRKAVGFPRHSEQDSWASALPTVTKEEKLLEILVKYGIRSGKTGNLGMEVDGLPFYDTHSAMIQQLSDITLQPVALA